MNTRGTLVALFLYAFLALSFFACLTSAASLLPAEEVEVLKTISAKLGNKYWNVTQTSCNDGVGLNQTFPDDGSGNDKFSHVICDCSFNGSTVCHVTDILLKGLSLPGVLPPDFAKLRFLRQLDLTRNYINGSIPTSFGQLPLTILSLLGNRISGKIPKEIGDISTLEQLVLEDNELQGPLDENLGRLSNLNRLLLSANNITGVIPETFGNLKNLTDFRIDGNPISGKVPNFIGNWTQLKTLYMLGTLLEGPIPPTISLLKNIEILQISGLRGGSMTFPKLEGMENITTLVLRNCSIADTIPKYIGDMSKLKTLDLSFNMLNGKIPTAMGKKIQYVFLAHNMLSGEIPRWTLESKDSIDLSYNNVTESSPTGCQASSVNLVSSYSVPRSDSNAWCSQKDLPCSSGKARYHSLFINCGGGRAEFKDNTYDEDFNNEGPSYFSASSDRWAYSSSGLFISNDIAKYVAANTFSSNVIKGDIYKTARLAPTSLVYYGFCMKQGSYKVVLHFAEIMFSNDSNYSSLGRRLFDVKIQGKVVLTDFNIAEEAKGAGIGITREFGDVLVNGSTLEIHLYWTGKGTNAIPQRGVHGPLISAITVTPNFNTDEGLSAGAIVGIVISCCVFALLILVALRMKGYLGGKVAEDSELRALDLQTGYFTLRQVKAATNNFDLANKIGEGGFGPVYKGVLSDGVVIAVKQLSSKSNQGNREFINEIGMITALQHPNLVKLHGCCIEGNQLLLIYEYMENNCLSRALFGLEDQRLSLDWQTRKKICLGIAKGLAYLHEESRLKIVHRDIKASNVLLDKDLNAKISDFGLAKLDEEENTHISTRIAGTIGYMAPEYAMRGYLTDKADVYSFGIVTLEIVSGKSNTNYRPKEEFVYLLDWAYVQEEQGNLLDLVDQSLGSNYPKEEALMMLKLALLCANPSPTLRPPMSSVVKMLNREIPVQAPPVGLGKPNDDPARFKAFKKLSHDSHTTNSSSTISKDTTRQLQRSISLGAPWTGSSNSFPSRDGYQDCSSTTKLLPDLYNVNLE
ncbi:probable LRR receptor-like serine/threonine-protein kinase At1g53430 isoform X1 [Ipomoea triloba]|uniref:probable LRR receptor-like serine/threonine-protein kinase At1g53430 isoform X1 n=1 Tax=Ipomoea triloba TaxID=35885 RepID=UPI00125D780E|nr:probable LRR receptor-like serine/threonine-protein kinase At1g53430 isoform X1 [Ipomoea triloba]